MITTDQVKALRQKTGAPMYDCKRALVESEGIEELAIWYLRNYPISPPYDWWRNKDGQAWLKRFEKKSKQLRNTERKYD